jgi:hypothetical protein
VEHNPLKTSVVLITEFTNSHLVEHLQYQEKEHKELFKLFFGEAVEVLVVLPIQLEILEEVVETVVVAVEVLMLEI